MNLLTRIITGKLRARWYAISYLSCVPLYMFVYSAIASDFHHATAKYERSLADDLDRIRNQFDGALKKHISSQYGESPVTDHGWIVRESRVPIGSAEFKDGVFHFSLLLVIDRNREHGPERASTNMVEMLVSPESFQMAGTNKFMMKRITIDGDTFTDFNPSCLIMRLPAEMNGKYPKNLFLPIPVELDQRLRAYTMAMNGFPASSSGTYERMFYLSMVTITTLGFGDILPISTRARLWVSSEAFLGVILVGLFLTSLSNSSSRPVSSTPHV